MTEKSPKRWRSSLVAEPAPTGLPYKPEEWEQRLVAARAQRETILQQRAAEQRRGADSQLDLNT